MGIKPQFVVLTQNRILCDIYVHFISIIIRQQFQKRSGFLEFHFY